MAVDTNFNNVVLLLHCDGANASTTFRDDSPTPKAVTANGNAQISTAQSKFGGASGVFDGTSDSVSAASSSDFGFGTGDFTIEFWVYANSLGTTGPTLFDARVGASDLVPVIYYTSSGLRYYANGADRITGATLSTTTWYHIALCRASGSTRMFLNGTQTGSTYTDGNNYITAPVRFGNNFLDSAGACLSGYMDDIRITKGVARYTANFTSPTIAHPNTDADANYDSVVLHLPCDGANASTSFPDTKGHVVTANGNAQISTAQSKWGGASYLGDGTGDYLSLPWNASDRLGASDFTVECWARFTGVATQVSLIDMRGVAGGDVASAWNLILNNTGHIVFQADTTAAGGNGGAWDVSLTSASALSATTWYHIAVTRLGSTWTLWIDGVSSATANSAITIGAEDTTGYIGGGAVGVGTVGYSVNGYIDNIRVTKGVARYTAAFTPPAGPFPTTGTDTNFASITLLLHGEGTNGSTYVEDASPSTKTVTCNGNAAISTAQAKWGFGSIAFDGVGDYLSVPASGDFGFGTGDYTIECWVYPTSATASDVIMDFRASGSPQLAVGLFRNTGGYLGFYLNGSYVIQSASTMSAAAWHHVALCRAAGTTKLFTDGAQVGSSYTDGNTYVSSAPLRIGAAQDATAGFAGNIDDVRITKGAARYTTAFTPQLGAFADALSLTPPSVNLGTKRLVEGFDPLQRAVPALPLYL